MLTFSHLGGGVVQPLPPWLWAWQLNAASGSFSTLLMPGPHSSRSRVAIWVTISGGFQNDRAGSSSSAAAKEAAWLPTANWDCSVTCSVTNEGLQPLSYCKRQQPQNNATMTQKYMAQLQLIANTLHTNSCWGGYKSAQGPNITWEAYEWSTTNLHFLSPFKYGSILQLRRSVDIHLLEFSTFYAYLNE